MNFSPVDAGWLLGLPKAEVHVHLEGCISPELLAEAAVRGGVMPPSQGPFEGLADFLHSLDDACRLLTAADDLVRLGREYALTTKQNGVVYSDVIINPGHWPVWAPRLDELVGLLDEGFRDAEAAGAARTGLCVSIGRWQSAAEANALVDQLLASGHERIVGVSLDGNEAAPGAGSSRFVPALERARAAGLYIAVHAGESSGPDGVRRALRELKPDRIDHGIRAVDDRALVQELVDSGVPLDICPSSNVALAVVSGFAEHPLEQLRQAGVRISLNTDDPLLFGTTLLREYTIAIDTFGWDRAVVATIARTSLDSTFAAPEHRKELVASLEKYLDPAP